MSKTCEIKEYIVKLTDNPNIQERLNNEHNAIFERLGESDHFKLYEGKLWERNLSRGYVDKINAGRNLVNEINAQYGVKVVDWSKTGISQKRYLYVNVKHLMSKLSDSSDQLEMFSLNIRNLNSIIASEKTIRDLAAQLSARIGMPIRFESDRTKEYKGKIKYGTAYINLAYATLDTPIHEILGHPIIRAIKDNKTSVFKDVNKSMSELEIPTSLNSFNTNNFEYRKIDNVWYKVFNGIKGEELTSVTDQSAKHSYSISKELKDHPQTEEQEFKVESQLYQNLIKELETGTGKEILDKIKENYQKKDITPPNIKNQYGVPLDGLIRAGINRGETAQEIANFINNHFETEDGEFFYFNYNDEYYTEFSGDLGPKPQTTEEEVKVYLNDSIKGPTINENYTLEEQQEEAIVTLLGLMTAEKLDAVKDGKLISLLKRLLKEMKQFIRSLINQKEVEISKLPDNMTINDLSDLLAYSNSKLILPGYEVTYTTPDNFKFKTYQEANNHISELAKNVKDVDLNDINLNNFNMPDKFEVQEYDRTIIYEKINDEWYEYLKGEDDVKDKVTEEYAKKGYVNNVNQLQGFIQKNREYEQSKEIIEEWKKVNNIQYNPEEIYSRGQEFSSVVGAYSSFDVNLMMQNLLQHIEDNEKAGGKFAISAYTKPIDRKIGHLEGGGGKIKFKLYPQSQDILWAANTDVYSGSVWDASEKVNKDKKSELLGVSYTKYPSLRNVKSIQPNLASIIDNLSHHHNELGITLTGNNFRLEYDDNIPYETKKIIDGINKILDQKYGKVIIPTIKKVQRPLQIKDWKISKADIQDGVQMWTLEFTYNDGTQFPNYDASFFTSEAEANHYLNEILLASKNDIGIQPTQTNDNTKSISMVMGTMDIIKTEGTPDFIDAEITKEEYESKITSRTEEEFRGESKDIEPFKEHAIFEGNQYRYFDQKGNVYFRDVNGSITGSTYKKRILKKQKEFTSQALINTKIAALKEVSKKYPRSLIRSEVKRSGLNYKSPNTQFEDDAALPFSKLDKPKKSDKQITKKKKEANNIVNEGLLDYARINGIKIQFLESLQSLYKENPVAVFNLVDNIIKINEGKADKTTLPEELAHHLTLALGNDHTLVKRAINLIKQIGVSNILGSEYEAYRIKYEGNENLLLHEALGKLISKTIVNKFDNVLPSTETGNKLWSTILKLIDKFIGLFKPNNNIMDNLQKNVDSLASMITEGKKIKPLPLVTPYAPTMEMYQYNTSTTNYDVPLGTTEAYAFVRQSIGKNKALIRKYQKIIETSKSADIKVLKDRIINLQDTIEKSEKVIKEMDSTGNLQLLINLGNDTLDYIDAYLNNIKNTKSIDAVTKNLEHIRHSLGVFQQFAPTAGRAADIYGKIRPLMLNFAREHVKEVYGDKFKEEDLLGGDDIFIGQAYIGTLTDVKNYIASTIGHVIKRAQSNVEQANRKAEALHDIEVKALHDYYKSKGLDTNKMYDKFIQEDNGTLVLTREYTSEFYDKIRKSFDEEDYNKGKDIRKGIAVWDSTLDKWVPRSVNYHNPTYTEIQKSPELKRFYDYFQKTTQDIFNKLPINGGKNFIPNVVEESLMDILKSDKKYAEKFKDTVEYITDIYDVEDNPNGKVFDKSLYPDTLPIKYVSKVDPSVKSKDLGRSLLKFIHFSNNYEEMTEILPKVKLLKEVIDTDKYRTYTNSKKTVNGSDSNISNIVKAFIDIQVLGNKKNEANLKLWPGYTLQYGKVIDFGIKYTSMLRIGFNPFNAFTNIAVGRIGNIIEARGGRYFNWKEYISAEKEFFTSMVLTDTKVHKMIELFNPLMELEDYEAIEKIGLGYLTSKKYQEKVKSAMYGLQKKGEYYLQSTTMIANLMHSKIVDKEGKESSLWEAFSKEGKWDTERFGELTEEMIYKISNRIQTINKNIHGRYSQKDAAALTQNVFFRAFFQFKKWMPAAYESRFQTKRYDATLEYDVEGRYLTYVKGFKLLASKLKGDVEAMERNGFDATDMYNMRKNLAELTVLVIASLAGLGLKADDDDDDLKKNGLYKFTMNQLNRISGDVVFFLDPSQQTNMLSGTAPVAKTIKDLITCIGNMPAIVGLMDNNEYTKGPRKGENKFAASLKDITIGVKPINDINRLLKDVPYVEPK